MKPDSVRVFANQFNLCHERVIDKDKNCSHWAGENCELGNETKIEGKIVKIGGTRCEVPGNEERGTRNEERGARTKHKL